MPLSKSAESSSSDGGKVVKTILSFLFLGIVCSSLNRTYNLICDLSKAEVNVEFGDSGDSITATATTRVEAPVGEQAADDPEEVGEHPYNFSKAWNKIIQIINDTSSYGEEDVEDTPEEKTGVKGFKTRKVTKKQKMTKKNSQKKKSK